MSNRKATPEETAKLFGNGLVIFGMRRPGASPQNSQPPPERARETRDPAEGLYINTSSDTPPTTEGKKD